MTLRRATHCSFFRHLFAVLTGLLLSVWLPAASAQSPWPQRSMVIVVPFPPGGTTDMLARSLAQQLGERLGQSVVVENRAGAGATLGAAHAAKASADGYTLFMGAVHHTIATSVYRSLSYDFQTDFAPIALLAFVPNVLVVNAAPPTQAPAHSVQDIINQAKQAPGELPYGSAGAGTLHNLIGAQFEATSGVQLLHVPYSGSGPLVSALLGGQVAMSFDTITPVLPHIRAGKLRALAVTAAQRSPALPDVPTLQEAGLRDFDMGTWFGLLAPKQTPSAVIERLNAEVNQILADEAFRARWAQAGAQAMGGSSQTMAEKIAADTAHFARLVKAAGITTN